jgi:hypothetical protein
LLRTFKSIQKWQKSGGAAQTFLKIVVTSLDYEMGPKQSHLALIHPELLGSNGKRQHFEDCHSVG